MQNKYFSFSERLETFSGPDNSYNCIDYYAGPIYISISGWNNTITIDVPDQWSFMLDDVLFAATAAWELCETDIVLEKNKIIINTNFKILSLYISHYIVFI